jgi:hypothetical protein
LQYQFSLSTIYGIKNKENILPIKSKSEICLHVKLGDDVNSALFLVKKNMLTLPKFPSDNIDTLNVKLKSFNTVIVGFHKSDGAWKNSLPKMN